MQDNLEQLNFTLSNIYIKNINYLRKEHPNTFEKVDSLSKLIEQNNYIEKYSLEYKEEGYFDILNLETKEFIYGFNSYIEADKRKDQVNFSTNSSLNLLRMNNENNKLLLMPTLEDTYPLINFLNKKIDFRNITFSKIFKFIFIGTGLGVHIHEVYKKIDAMNTLIIEPNLEIFRLSLFLIDYTVFSEGNKKLYLSINESSIEREQTLVQFRSDHSYMNYNIKHHLFSIKHKYLLDEIKNFFATDMSLSFSYNVVLNMFDRTLNIMKKKKPFLIRKEMDKHAILKDKKVLLISAGPSLDKTIDWIKESQNKFIVICVDIILKKLIKHSIIPDIIISIDPKPEIVNFFNFENKHLLKNSVIIFLSQQNEQVFNEIEDIPQYFLQALPIKKDLGEYFSIPNVGTFSFAIATFLGARELYLIGNDAAFDQETGSRYAKDNSRVVMDKLDNIHKKEDTISKEDTLEVKGNFREKIKTNIELLRFKQDYEFFIHTYLNNTFFRAYNLSDGAYIEGLTPIKYKDIQTSDFSEKTFDNDMFKNISTKINDLNFEKDILVLNRMIQKVKKFKKDKIHNKDEFLSTKLDLMIWILEQKKIMSSETFGNIFLKFINVIDIYVNFSLNIKYEKFHNKENLLQIKNNWSDSLINLLKKLKTVIS